MESSSQTEEQALFVNPTLVFHDYLDTKAAIQPVVSKQANQQNSEQKEWNDYDLLTSPADVQVVRQSSVVQQSSLPHPLNAYLDLVCSTKLYLYCRYSHLALLLCLHHNISMYLCSLHIILGSSLSLLL